MVQLETIRRVDGSASGVIFDPFRLLKGLRGAPQLVGGAPQLVGGDVIGIEEQWRLLDALYDFKPTIFATAAIFLASMTLWSHRLPVEAGLWMLSSLVLLAARFVLSRAYTRRSSSEAIRTWMNRYYVAVVLTGFQWGLGGLLLVQTNDGAASSAIFGVEAALMAGAAARGYFFPVAAIAQVNLTALMIAIFSLVAGQYVFFFLMILYCLHQTAFIMSLTEIKLKEIRSERQRHELLRTLGRTNEALASANTKLHAIATTDALTGIANRRGFELELATRWTQAVETRTALSLLLIDVDQFKRFNDAHGHPAGDRCLALVAAAMKSIIRHASDHAARYGGEEFALILPASDFDAARTIAERLTAAVRSIMVPVADNQTVGVTVSVGIGSLTPDATAKDSLLISLADQALYRAKQDGRDRVC